MAAKAFVMGLTGRLRSRQMYLRLRPLLFGLALPLPRQRDWARHQLHLLHLNLHPSLRLPLNRQQKSREKAAIAARETILRAVTPETREESPATPEKAIKVLLGLLLFSFGIIVGLLIALIIAMRTLQMDIVYGGFWA